MRSLGLLAVVLAVACDGVFSFDRRVLPPPSVPDAAAAAADMDGGAPEPDGPAAPDTSAAPPDLPMDRLLPADRQVPVDVATPADRGLDVRPDAASDPPAAPVLAPLIGWNPSNCAGAGCDLECRDTPSCSGACGATCHARCRNGTNCSLTATTAADLECREAATCAFVMSGGVLRCRESASCTVRCLGTCTLNCEDATCRLQCPADPAPRTVAGPARCP
jgi:hypothetical protein